MKKSGFTLSEVLMTLAIFGVIVAITVPMFSQAQKNHEYKTGYKKALSTTNQAIKQHYAFEGMTVQDYISAEDLVENLFKERMNTINGDSSFTNEECSSYGDSAVFTTADGMIFCVSNFATNEDDSINSTCDIYDKHPCTEIEGPNLWIDVNGERKPNKLTMSPNHPKDIFQAQIYAHKILPYGEAETEIIYGSDDKDTSSKSKDNEDSEKQQGQDFLDKNEGENNSQNQENNKPDYNTDKNGESDNSGNNFENDENVNKPNPNYSEDPSSPDENNENDENYENNEDDENINNEDNNEEDIPDENNPYYDQWDSRKWPSWLEFLRWILQQIAKALTP